MSDDRLDVGDLVVVKLERGAEAGAQRPGKQMDARCRRNHGEGRQVKRYRARARPLADNKIQLPTLQGRVKHLFNILVQAMRFVDKKYIAAFQVGKDRRQVAHFFQGGP